MKIYHLIKKQALLILCLGVLLACVKDQDFSTPNVTCVEPFIQVTNTIQQVKEMYKFGGATIIETDVVIEGYVVSSDESGNIYKTISIQDKPKNPTAAIKLSINQSNLYTKYNVGRKIYVQLKGLAIGYSFGSFQIGIANGRELDRIPLTEVNNYIIRSCEVAEITPRIMQISELSEEHLEMLIQIENVQFKENELGKSYGNLDNSETVNRTIMSFTNECSFKNEIVLRNSGYSKFKNELLPEGRGSITSIFSNYYDDFQLYIRDTEDVNFSEERCNYSNELTPTISLKQVREMYNGEMVEFGISTAYIVEGFVVSSDEQGNFEHKLVIQDAIENPTAGIQLLLESETIFEQFNVGDKVLVKLNKLYMNQKEGVLSFGFLDRNKVTEIDEESIGDFIYYAGETSEIKPSEITITQIDNPDYESTLVKVVNVQLMENELGAAFAYFSGNDDGVRMLETCNESNKLSIFTNGEASFANDLFPEDRGSITGILTTNLEIRKLEDVQFTEPFKVCPVIIPKIMITEIADPKNSTTARFVELYNAGDSEINLTNWKLNKYVNGSTSVSSSPIEFSGITIPKGGFVIIANTGFSEIFGFNPTLEASYISGNGDDVYELVDNVGNRIDIYGIIGEDGNGTNWEYLDGSAVRNFNINEPNKTFNINEWTVSSDVKNSFINHPNTPKLAPNDFNPNYR